MKNVEYITTLLSLLLELRQENAVLWSKLERYRMIEAKELGK